MKKLTLVLALSFPVYSLAQAVDISSGDSSASTKNMFDDILKTLPMSDIDDFNLAKKGLIAQEKDLQIKDANGKVVWELGSYKFLLDAGQSADTIHPSLKRQAMLNMNHGLYKVTDGIYQVRGYDLANITFIQSDNGWIVFDPLTVPATSKAAYELVSKHLGKKPIVAVVYSHTHADHFGGVKGIISQEDVDSGKVKVIAPAGFTEHAVSENVLAGNAMARRATYQYGNMLPKNAKGQVDAAIGKGVALGETSFIKPNIEISNPVEEITIDGVTMVMQNTPGTEAPVEMNTWLPQFKTFWAAENTIGGLHNAYTLRGAPVRDLKVWSAYINQALMQFGQQADVIMASHTWPRWGNENITGFLEKQRDMYGFIHNESLRLANHGVTIDEIQDEFKVPKVLAKEWYNRGYHGSYHRNAKAVINRYLGYSDLNPAKLLTLSPAEAAPRYVAVMGGIDNVLAEGKKASEKGDYRWCAEVVNYAVFAQPQNEKARLLQADCLEQLGYQSESAGERNSFLMGAYELRNGVPDGMATKAGSPDMLAEMPVSSFLDYMAVRMDGNKVAEDNYTLTANLTISDSNEKYLITVQNGNMSHIQGYLSDKPDVSLILNRDALRDFMGKKEDPETLQKQGRLIITGDKERLAKLNTYLDDFSFWFNIVTPNDHSSYSHGFSLDKKSPVNR
ncbi:alkyl/aryl-sulfatase [Morganella psychrotolerans]|uniref:alkyl/aryl-sulfatase n=1 Tax=Morganella psychrotolerans TaxID=368603 RepID=UPI0039B0AD8A